MLGTIVLTPEMAAEGIKRAWTRHFAATPAGLVAEFIDEERAKDSTALGTYDEQRAASWRSKQNASHEIRAGFKQQLTRGAVIATPIEER